MLNIEKSASYEVLLHVQGVAFEESTMHPLALPGGGRHGTNVVYKDYALTSILVGVSVAYEF